MPAKSAPPQSSAVAHPQSSPPTIILNEQGKKPGAKQLVLVELDTFLPQGIERDFRDTAKLAEYLQSPGAMALKKLNKDPALQFVIQHHDAVWGDAALEVCKALGLQGTAVSPSYIFKDIYQPEKNVMQAFGVNGAGDCLFIGHDRFDVENARNAGMQPLDIGGPYNPKRDKKRIADAVAVLKNDPQ